MSDIATKMTSFIKLLYSLFKRNNADKEKTCNTTTSKEDETVYVSNGEVVELDLESSQVRPIVKEKIKIDLITSGDRPEIGKKNKWLYPADGFGKMEHGIVDNESK